MSYNELTGFAMRFAVADSSATQERSERPARIDAFMQNFRNTVWPGMHPINFTYPFQEPAAVNSDDSNTGISWWFDSSRISKQEMQDAVDKADAKTDWGLSKHTIASRW